MEVAILEARNVTKTIDTGTHRVEILRGVNLSVPAGQLDRKSTRLNSSHT